MAQGRRKRETPARIAGPCVLLVVVVLALTALGVVMVYSSSMYTALADDESPAYYAIRQFLFALLGIAVALVVRLIPLRCWQGLSGGNQAGILLWVAWLAVIALIVVTKVMGIGGDDADINATRWVLGIQPSEFAKIVFILVTVQIMVDFRAHRLALFQALCKLIVLVGVPLALMAVWQSDFGTAVIVAIGILAVLWLGDVPWQVLVGIGLCGVAVLAIAVLGFGYNIERFNYIYAFSEEYHTSSNWQTDHALWAFAEGGVFGVGLGNSRMKYLWLTASHTDFIYAVIGEELGLVGALFVVVLYLLFLYAGMSIAKEAVDSHGAILAGSLTLMIVFQAFLNIGFNIGILPTTGKTLPFVSYGGSSLLATYIMVGLILAVARDAATTSVYERRRENLRIVRAVDEERPRGTDGSRSRGASTGRARATGRSAAAPRFRATATQRSGRR